MQLKSALFVWMAELGLLEESFKGLLLAGI
jgi:hypothetical protein